MDRNGSAAGAGHQGNDSTYRKASVPYQMQQRAKHAGTATASGRGQDASWLKRIHEERDAPHAPPPLETFKKIACEIRRRSAAADESDRLGLLRTLVDEFVYLQRRHPRLVAKMDGRPPDLTITVGDDDTVLAPDTVDHLRAYDLDLGIPGDMQTCIYRIRCKDCPANYVGQTTDRAQRVRNHRHAVNARKCNASLYQHAVTHGRLAMTQYDFDESYTFVVLMEIDEGAELKARLDAAEKLWQWLLKALKDDGGSGKR